MEKELKMLGSFILGCLAAFTEQYGMIISLVFIVIVFDIITGITKTKFNGDRIESKKGTKGFFKKLSLILALFFGIFIDFAIPVMLTVGFDTTLPFGMPAGMVMGCYIILNESISICENLNEINPGLIPKFLVEALKLNKDKIVKEG